VDVLLWFHGDTHVWSAKRKKETKKDLYLWGKSIQDYLKVEECLLREFILQSSKRQFVLVAPTLGDRSCRGPKHTAGGLLWQQADAEAYVQQAVNGVKKHLGISVTRPSRFILAAHSGGGHVLSHLAQFFSGSFDKANAVWCFDCTYWGGEPFIARAKKGRSNHRLWVYSTGWKGNGLTGDSANAILSFAQSNPPGANIEVLIDDYPTAGSPSSTNNFIASYHGSAGGHYESIQKYLPQLVERSKNLD
jgi:hypothetical protein